MLKRTNLLVIYMLYAVATARAQPGGAVEKPGNSAPSKPITIMAFEVSERDEDHSVIGPRITHENEKTGWITEIIMEEMQEKYTGKFDILDASQIERIRKIKVDAEKLANKDLTIIQQEAASAGAEYYMVVFGHVIGPVADDRTTPGVRKWRWDAFAKARIYRTADGKIFGVKEQSDLAASENEYAGRIDAKRAAGRHLAAKITKLILQGERTEDDRGHNYALTVTRCAAAQASLIKRAVAGMSGVTVLNDNLGRGVLTLRFLSKSEPIDLSAALSALRFDGFSLEVEEAKDGVITATINAQ